MVPYFPPELLERASAQILAEESREMVSQAYFSVLFVYSRILAPTDGSE
jgi:hypothetical protein